MDHYIKVWSLFSDLETIAISDRYDRTPHRPFGHLGVTVIVAVP